MCEITAHSGCDGTPDNSMEFVSKPWVKTEDYWDAYYELMEKIKEKFDENGIVLPQVNVVVKSK